MYKYAIFTQTMREETISCHRPVPGLKSEVRGVIKTLQHTYLKVIHSHLNALSEAMQCSDVFILKIELNCA